MIPFIVVLVLFLYLVWLVKEAVFIYGLYQIKHLSDAAKYLREVVVVTYSVLWLIYGSGVYFAIRTLL